MNVCRIHLFMSDFRLESDSRVLRSALYDLEVVSGNGQVLVSLLHCGRDVDCGRFGEAHFCLGGLLTH